MIKKEKYKEFSTDIEYLKLLEKRLSEIEYPDVALETYYHKFEPSDLLRFLINFLETEETN